ncbi:hypothetical protein [Algoriphagus boritolerans]|uniref:hypothetical protein n=1 Tax=Algoriphagus boritolerans TaxID=308111 RepID=UPI000AD4EFB7
MIAAYVYTPINSSAFFSIVPPKDEQDAIVQYIKAQEEKVNRFIVKKLRFIELLKEQKKYNCVYPNPFKRVK